MGEKKVFPCIRTILVCQSHLWQLAYKCVRCVFCPMFVSIVEIQACSIREIVRCMCPMNCAQSWEYSHQLFENWRRTYLLKDKKYSKCCKTSFFSRTNNSHHMVTKKQTYSNKQVTCTVWWESAQLIECSRKRKILHCYV